LFIAIVWVNHHHLLHYATEATPRLMWFNFAHLFSVSLLPLSRGKHSGRKHMSPSTLKRGGNAFRRRSADVRFGSKADMCATKGHVCFAPESGHVRCTSLCLLWAKSGHLISAFFVGSEEKATKAKVA
jgi:hypothetical protein